MKISDVKIFYVRHEFSSKFEPAWGDNIPGISPRETCYPVVAITADDGNIGIGAGSEYATEVERSVRRLSKYLIGRDVFEVEKFSKLVAASTRQYGTFLGCLDIAVWDLIGKSCGQPIYKILGSYQTRVKPYVSFAKMRSPQETVEVVDKIRKEGYSAFKLRFHTDKPEKEVEAVKVLRDKFGKDLDIMVDGNQMCPAYGRAWSFKDAVRTARALEKLDVYFFEEPLHVDNQDGYSRLTKAVEIPIAGGETESNPTRFRDYIDNGVYDIVQPDVTFTGITGARQVGIISEIKNKLCILHTWNAGGLGLAANLQLAGALSNCPFLEFPYDPPAWTIEARDRFLRHEIKPNLGYVSIPNRPGLGVDVDLEQLEKASIGWEHCD